MNPMSAAACFLAATALFLVSASPTVSLEDTGEMIMAAQCLGVTHPPGYQWLVFLGHLAMRLPVGSPAFRLTLLNVLLGAAAVTCVFAVTRLLLRRLAAAGPPLSRLGPWAAAIAFAAGRTMWWQSSFTEQYPLAIALQLAAVLVLVHAWFERRTGQLALAVFLSGVSLSHHGQGLYLVPVTALATLRLRHTLARGAVLGFLFCLPLAAKVAVIPVMSAANPRVNWTAPCTAPAFVDYITARQFKHNILTRGSIGEIAVELMRSVAVRPVRELGPSLVFCAPAIAALRAGLSPALTGAAVILASNLFFAVSVKPSEVEPYYLLSYGILCVLTGIGAAKVLRVMPRWGPAALLIIAVHGLFNAQVSPRSRYYLAHDLAVNQLGPLPPGSVIFCGGGDQSYPLTYLNETFRYREDVRALHVHDLCSKTANRKMAAHYPDLVFPPLAKLTSRAFHEDPGAYLPRFMAANAGARKFFCTPFMADLNGRLHLFPFGLGFEAIPDGKTGSEPPSLRSLRYRGIAAGAPRDSVSEWAAVLHGGALAIEGVSALRRGRLAEAEETLRRARRYPLGAEARAGVNTELGRICAAGGRTEEAEKHYREALRAYPAGFAPAMLALAQLLLENKRDLGEVRDLLENALRNPAFLSGYEKAELDRLTSLMRVRPD